MKKLSKRLLAMLLVAVMVVAAIPFGAFAAPCGADHSTDTSLWEYDSTGTVTATTHPLKCKNTGCDWTGAAYHTLGADGKCTVCSYEHTPHTYDKTTHKCTVCGYEHQCIDSDWAFNGVKGTDGSTHTEVCTFCGKTRAVNCTISTTAAIPATCTTVGKTEYKACSVCGWNNDGGKDVPALGHIDENCDGKCDREGCNQNMEVKTKTYKVVVKKADKVTVLAEGQSVTYNQAQIDALNSASTVRTFLNGLGGDYATCSGKMGDAYFKGVEVMSSDAGNYLHIYMDLPETSNTLPNTGDTFDVTFTIDGGTSYTRTVNVGDWYFNAGMAGNANGWGNKQVSLRITNALGSKRLVDWNSKDSSAYVQRGDVSVEIFSKLKTVKIVFLKNEVCSVKDSNGTTVEYEWGSALGQLPELPYGYGYWCVDGKEITATTIYNWELDKVYARPVKQTADHNGNVHLFVYNSSNQLMKDFDVTVKVQDNGMLFLDDLVSMIKNNTGVSSVSSAGLMDESGWAYYLNNKNSTKYAKSGLLMGTAAEREGVQNVYVVLKNVSGNSNADTSNPKTGDTAMIGTAAIVMALATVGMGTAFYMKKKELF